MSIIRNNMQKNNMDFYIPFVDAIAETAKEIGVQVYFVGGCVRDAIMGKKASDADIVPFGTDYKNFARVLSKKIKAFSIPFKDNVRLAKGDLICDVSKPRGKDIYQDLLMRDFTINNLAAAPCGDIIGDDKHIKEGLIKAVSENVFDDDPLRILRAFRFVSTLGFDIDEDTLNLIKNKQHLIKLPAAERVTEELRKTLCGAYCEKALSYLKKTNTAQIIFDENDLDFESPLRLNQPSFPLRLALLAGKNAAKPLKLSSKEEKTVTYIAENLTVAVNLHDKSLREKRAFLWKHYSLAKELFDGAKSKFPQNTDTLAEDFKLIETLYPQRAKAINGSVLMKAGFKPSPFFSLIIEETALKLALGELEESQTENYIMTAYGDKK